MEEEKGELGRLIKEDNVKEFERILNSNPNLRNELNTLLINDRTPLIHFAVHKNSQKVLEYLLSQDFVDKNICNTYAENIYHVVCSIRGSDEIFSIIARNVDHKLILNKTRYGINAFHIACSTNNIFIVKRVYEIMESLKINLTKIKNETMQLTILNEDIQVIKFVLSIDGIHLRDNIFFNAIESTEFEIAVYLLNFYLYKSIPSHLHNQFHIFQFTNHPFNNNNNLNHNNNNDNDNDNNSNDKNDNNNNNENNLTNYDKILLDNNTTNNNNNEDMNNDYEYYLKLVEENYNKLIDIKLRNGNRLWHSVCSNQNLNVVRLIYSLKGIQPEILNRERMNPFLLACEGNPNIKVIKFLHKLFPSLFHSFQINSDGVIRNAASIVLSNSIIDSLNQLKALHYLYLNEIDFHLLMTENVNNEIEHHIDHIDHSIYSYFLQNDYRGMDDEKLVLQYVKVISQDFDYIHHEHDNRAYRKPSFWKEIDDGADGQSIRVNEWKNRYEEHVIRNLSKMIQEHMDEPKSLNLGVI